MTEPNAIQVEAAVSTDMIECRQSQRLLQESEERFRCLVMAAQSGIVLQERDGRITAWNATAERVFGISASQVIGLDATSYNWKTYREDGTPFPGSEHPSIDTFTTGQPCTGVIMKVMRDTGDFSWININTCPLFRDEETTPYAVVITFSDITTRKIAEMRLKKNKEIFSLFLKHSPIYTYIKEVTDGESRVLYASDNFKQMIGMTGAEIVGKTMAELFPQELAEKINADDLTIVANGNVVELEEVYNDRTYTTVKFPIVFEDQTLLAGFTIDITDRKQAEEALVVKSQQLEYLNQTLESRIAETVRELREKDELLIQQGRLAAMGEMINNIAHQWRQPLNNIGLIVQNLQLCFNSGTLTSAIVNKDISNTMQLLQQMSGTINDFRNFFSQEKTLQPFEVNEAIRRSINFMLPSLKCSNISVSYEEQPEITTEGYPGEYTQAVLNILTNAKDVLLERGIAKPCITVRVFRENNRSVVTISDNGGGIPDDLLPKIFDPYFTTKHKSTGTGIGLFMSKMIIEKNMHGRLTARNIVDGAEFRIEL